MKKIIITAAMLSVATMGCAQTFEEWFRQKATQKKYLLQQIAALRVYSGYLSKGYQVVKSGLSTIEHIKNGDFSLHDSYFNSLKTISPKLKGYPKIAGIALLQTSISEQASATIKFCKKSGQLSHKELLWIETSFTALIADCTTNFKALSSLTMGGEYSMKDNERMSHIDDIFKTMFENEIFCRSFSNSCRVLCIQRKNDHTEILQSQKLNGLK